LKFEIGMNKHLAGLLKVFIIAIILIYSLAVVIMLLKG